MTKKLKIIGPYTPEHPGPFCTRDGRAARVICTDRKGRCSTVALVTESDGQEDAMSFYPNGRYKLASNSLCDVDLMNAEEVPVAREFWLVGCNMYETREAAEDYIADLHRITLSRLEIIHVREVLPGDGE